MVKAKRVLQKETMCRNFLGELVLKCVGTNEIESLARQVRLDTGGEGSVGREGVEGDTIRRKRSSDHVKEVKRITKVRLLISDAKIKGAIIKAREASAGAEEVSTTMPRQWMCDWLEVMKEELARAWQVGKVHYAKKARWLTAKFSSNTNNILTSGSEEGKHLMDLVCTSDKDIDKYKEGRQETVQPGENFVIVGDGVTLDEEEKKYLSLPPKFRLAVPVDELRLEREAEKMSVKARWSLIGDARTDKEFEEKKDSGITMEELKKAVDKEYADEGRIYDQESMSMDMSKLRVSDLRHNTRAFPPPPAPPGEEILIQLQKLALLNASKRYTSIEGAVTSSSVLSKSVPNITKEEEKGRVKIKNKIKNGQMVIFPTGCQRPYHQGQGGQLAHGG